MPYSNNSFLLSSFLQSSSQTRYLHCAGVFILFRDCYEMGHQKNSDLKETYNKVLSPESDKKKTWPCPWIGRAWLSARRRTQRAQKHKRLQEECKMQRSTDAHLSTQNAQSNVHTRTNTAPQQKLDGPHKARDVNSTSHKCQVWHEQRAKVCHHIDRDWIHFDNVLSVAKNTFENADKFVIEDSFFCTKTTISLFDTPSICT